MSSQSYKPQPNRLNEIDFIKVVAIVCMILKHTNSEIIKPASDDTVHLVFEFLGGAPAAPVFLFAMGVGVVYTSHNKPIDYFRRGIVIFLTGYVLNVIRGVIPALIFLPDLSDTVMAIYAFNIDILQFAGMAFMLIGLMRSVNMNRWHILIIAAVMWVVAQLFGVVNVGFISNYIVGLFIFTSSADVAFPLFTWFIMVAVGIFVGSYIKETDDRAKVYRKLLPLGLVFIAIVTSYMIISDTPFIDYFREYAQNYFKLAPPTTLWCIGFVFVLVSVAYYFVNWIKSERLDRTTHYISKNLNRIYLVQWTIIGWAGIMIIAYEIYLTNAFIAIPVALAILAICIALMPTYDKVVKKIRSDMSESRSKI